MDDQHEPGIFFAFASKPQGLFDCINSGVEAYRRYSGSFETFPWSDMDVGGQIIWSRIFNEIDKREYFVADISVLNANVIFEIGFAIDREKKIRLFLNEQFKSTDDRSQLGIFDVLGYDKYDNADQLAEKLFGSIKSSKSIFVDSDVDLKAPIFLLDAYEKSELVNHIKTCIKKRLVRFRSFDPQEQARIPVHEAIREVARSDGIVASLVPNSYPDAQIHNLRAAFICGLAHGMSKLTKIIQLGDGTTPLDFREHTDTCFSKEQVEFSIDKFALDVTPRLQGRVHKSNDRTQTLLEKVDLGGSVAENEIQTLDSYYLDTDAFLRTLRGEVRLIIGRKGSGKSALFIRVRNLKRRSRKNVVIDLKPEGYKLLKFKEQIESMMSAGSLNHIITAIWEYVVLLEISFKLLDQDAQIYSRDPSLTEKYETLAKHYQHDEYSSAGDFSERLSVLLDEIAQSLERECSVHSDEILSERKVTEIIYRHPIHDLRQAVMGYLQEKEETWVLVDNLDKGWPNAGVTKNDVLLINCLIDSLAKVERSFRQKGYSEFYSTVFLRSDVYDNLVDQTSDRGKVLPVQVDWSDADALKEMLRKRFIFSGFDDALSIEDIWDRIAVKTIGDRYSLDAVVENSLYRPRALLDFIYQCKSTAVNRRHDRIEEADFEDASRAFSVLMIENISLELRDIRPEFENILYEFVGREPSFNRSTLNKFVRGHLGKTSTAELIEQVFRLLLWFGFLGVRNDGGEPKYIFDTSHNMKMIEALAKRGNSSSQFVVHPAFRAGLSIGELKVAARVTLL